MVHKTRLKNQQKKAAVRRPVAKPRKSARPTGLLKLPEQSRDWLKIAFLHFEKCDLKESYQAFLNALELARLEKDSRAIAEALAGLLRFSGEALDDKKIEYWEDEINELQSRHPEAIPPMVWYCRGAIATFREEWKTAQRHFHRYLRHLRSENPRPPRSPRRAREIGVLEGRGLAMLVQTLLQRGHLRRAKWLADEVLKRIEERKLKGLNGVIYLMLGTIAERKRELDIALQWYQKSHAAFLEEHNWYHHLYVLCGYARLARLQRNYSQAYWYLDLIDKAARDPGFGVMRRELERERARLEQDAVDLLIDSRRGFVQARGGEQISLNKQYVLLGILRALMGAHQSGEEDGGRGLSKAEIIEKVWGERYRPEAHDNKLYYNINRLRKLIEPDAKRPQLLVNWKEGYRLAPGLKVQWLGPSGKSRTSAVTR